MHYVTDARILVFYDSFTQQRNIRVNENSHSDIFYEVGLIKPSWQDVDQKDSNRSIFEAVIDNSHWYTLQIHMVETLKVNQRCIHNPLKPLRWILSRKQLIDQKLTYRNLCTTTPRHALLILREFSKSCTRKL